MSKFYTWVLFRVTNHLYKFRNFHNSDITGTYLSLLYNINHRFPVCKRAYSPPHNVLLANGLPWYFLLLEHQVPPCLRLPVWWPVYDLHLCHQEAVHLQAPEWSAVCGLPPHQHLWRESILTCYTKGQNRHFSIPEFPYDPGEGVLIPEILKFSETHNLTSRILAEWSNFLKLIYISDKD